MSDFATPSLAEQAAILHAFVDRRRFSLESARAVVDALEETDESQLVSALRQRLQLQRVKLGHMQASQVAAQLRGRRGMNDRQEAPAFGLQFAAVGHAGEDAKFARFNDAARVFVSNVSSFCAHLRQPHAATLTRNHRAVMCSFGEVMQPGYAIALLTLADESRVSEWIAGMPTFLESLRRTVEEADSPGVLAGYACARYGTVGHKNSGELELWRGGLRVSVGHELDAYSALLERWTPEQVEHAVANGSGIRIGGELLPMVYALRETEPLLRVSNYVSQHPVTESLLKRAQRFINRDLMHSLVKPAAAIRYPAGSGLPESVVLNDETLGRLLAERELSRTALAERLGIDADELRAPVPIGLFIRVATFFEVADYNKLVGRISRDAWVNAQSHEVLQGLLDVTDAVSFALSSQISPEDREIVNEAAEDLAAARWAQQQNRAGAIQGLDGAVHSVDAEEFLAQLQEVNCVVRAGVKPFFTPVPDFKLPAVGKRLVIAVLPATLDAS
ncbi:hypothetical protein ISG08_05860 [Burkholderia pseudomallei]|uniref:hypothetical protein n=2 Tax=Burkholderia pseudomallei TaxID=28450 RepID=UPI00016B1E9B|nr:hypothetical protein [Burkholderia pseudomallei]AIP71896.1 hypothetical protein DU27_3520 [Burkholderia pseudomallei]AJW90177.1 NLP/P60 family domain protein [Burkholderia pseudomallei 406e]AJX38795.1 hypothetical protein DP45_09 [Burkholderia pseudomallei]MBF3690869.1 hypothetical protein [Burkholderia pseudomallei]MBF3802552.1 hypothetical protein [Burkholderia pseudomallei]